MAIGDESFDELDEVSDHTYDELYDAFKELHDDWTKIGKKNACFKKKMVGLINENESLSAKITCLELENKILHDRIEFLIGKKSTSHEYEKKSNIDDLIKENKELKKKSNKLNKVVFKFTNGQENLEKSLSSKNVCLTKEYLGYKHNLK